MSSPTQIKAATTQRFISKSIVFANHREGIGVVLAVTATPFDYVSAGIEIGAAVAGGIQSWYPTENDMFSKRVVIAVEAGS
jgi:hypothetical protein